MDWVEGDSATLTMNFTVNDDMTKYLESLDCPISIQARYRHCEERKPLVIEGCVIRKDEDGFYIEYPDEYVGLIANWFGREE